MQKFGILYEEGWNTQDKRYRSPKTHNWVLHEELVKTPSTLAEKLLVSASLIGIGYDNGVAVLKPCPLGLTNFGQNLVGAPFKAQTTSLRSIMTRKTGFFFLNGTGIELQAMQLL